MAQNPEKGVGLALGVNVFCAAIVAASLSPIHAHILERQHRTTPQQHLGQIATTHVGFREGVRSAARREPVTEQTPRTLHDTHEIPAAPTTTAAPNESTTTTRPLTLAQQAAKIVTPAIYAAWHKVNMCEEGGNWHVIGADYSGGLGISNINWAKYGGLRYAANAAYATPDEQIVTARHIQLQPPDQDGQCRNW